MSQSMSLVPKSVLQAAKTKQLDDGGADPTIKRPQFPMGSNKLASTSNAIAKRVDAEGRVKYDALLKIGQRPDKIIYSKHSDVMSKPMGEFASVRPDESDLQETTDSTREALERIVAAKTSAAMPVQFAQRQGDPVFMRYTAAHHGPAFNSGSKQSIIKIHDVQVDPMEPPKFRTNKKIPRAEGSPPAPVLHSPTKKLTVKEQQQWKIPPCISNWKNSKGYTIPLDKRFAADNRGMQMVHLNEKFSELARALDAGTSAAFEEIGMRQQVEKQFIKKQNEEKNKKLAMLAEEARRMRTGLSGPSHDPELKERNALRQDLARDRGKARNIAKAAPEKRNKLQRERERDISEKIALGLPKSNTDSDGMYDQRLFNQSMGLDSGFAAGDDERYDVYDKPFGNDKNMARNIYKAPTGDSGVGGRDPVQFEKDDDPFGLEKFLDDAKKSRKRKECDDGSRDRSDKSPKKPRRS